MLLCFGISWHGILLVFVWFSICPATRILFWLCEISVFELHEECNSGICYFVTYHIKLNMHFWQVNPNKYQHMDIVDVYSLNQLEIPYSVISFTFFRRIFWNWPLKQDKIFFASLLLFCFLWRLRLSSQRSTALARTRVEREQARAFTNVPCPGRPLSLLYLGPYF